MRTLPDRLLVRVRADSLEPCRATRLVVTAPSSLRVERVVVPDDVARDFMVADVLSGNCSQLPGTGALPASALSASSVLRPDLEDVGPGRDLVLEVWNQAAERRSFRAEIWGHPRGADEVPPPRPLCLLGLGSTLVEPGSAATVLNRLREVVRPVRLVVDSGSAPHFVVTSIRLGGIRQVPRGREISAAVFAEDAEAPELGGTVARPGHKVAVDVRCDSDVPRTFRAALLCQRLPRA